MKRYAGLIFICAVFLSLGILRVNDLTLYTPDSIRYLVWGNSIAHGGGFVDDTQPDPDRYVVHAPFVSLILAPVEAILPLSVQASKVWILLFGVLSLVMLYRWFELLWGKTTALIGSIVVAFNPLTLIYSTEILSEIPFVACICSIFFLSELMFREEQPNKFRFGFLVLLLSMLPLIRDAGLALVGAIFLFLLSKKKKAYAGIALSAPLIVYGLWYIRNEILVGAAQGSEIRNTALVLQHFLTPESSSLVNEFALRMWLNLKEYFLQLAGMAFYPLFSDSENHLMLAASSIYEAMQSVFNVGKYLIVIIELPVLFVGMKNDLKGDGLPKLRLIFLIGYLLIILLYPIHDIRFLFPLLPLLLFYNVVGMKFLANNRSMFLFLKNPKVLVSLVLFSILPNVIGIFEITKANIAYTHSPMDVYHKLSSNPGSSNYYSYPWSRLGDWIKNNLEADAIIASPSKELVTVAGGRKVLELSPGLPLPQFESELRDNRVSYVLAPVHWADVKTYDLQMNESKRFTFERQASFANLGLYKVHRVLRLREGALSSLQSNERMIDDPPPIDTLSASGLLRKGRRLLLNEEYAAAEQSYRRALPLAPEQPELVFQHAVSFEMLGDSSRAMEEYRKLLTLPQAGSYILLSRTHIQAMSLLSQARQSKSYEEYAVKTFQASQFYWNLGYPKKANRLLNKVFEKDSSYFYGLLWGTHYNLQLGDTAKAKDYLRRLDKLDVTNAVVQGFHRVVALVDLLSHSNNNEQRSQIHLTIAQIYRQLELMEEAIDEAQWALDENPMNHDANLFLGKQFETKLRLRTAEYFYKQVLEAKPGDTFVAAKVDSLTLKISRQ